jgi:hypothetical protein
MAITINSTPEAYPSMHDDLWYVVTSTNTNQVNFKYVFDVYVNSSLVARIKTFADPSSSKGIFNASNIIRNYWTSYFKPNTTTTFWSYTGNDIYVPFEIRFGEEYDGSLYTNLASGNYKAFNFYNPVFRDPSTSYFQPYISKWLTNRDKSKLECAIGEHLYMGWMNTAASTPTLTMTVQKYLPGGATDGSPVTSSTETVQSFVLVDLSPAAINAELGQSLITAATYQYGVKINYGGNSSDELKIMVACSPKFTPVTLHFLNQLGGYDSFMFRAVNRQNKAIDRKQYERSNWQLNSGTMQSYDSYKRMYEGANVFSVQQGVSFRLQSDYIGQTDYTWLSELIASPEVYMENGGYYYPVAVKTASWDEKFRAADKMFNMILDVDYGRKINSQYR